MIRIGVVTGLRAEAAIVRRATGADDRVAIAVAAASGERAHALALEMLDAGAGALISFGMAGGLDPAFSPGMLVLADAVVAPGGDVVPTDAALRSALKAASPMAAAAEGGTIAGSDSAVVTAAGKARLHAATGAVAVDMESHGVARAARSRGAAFAVLRAIADPAGRALPGPALAGMGPEGETRILAVLGAAAQQPRTLPGLLALARDSRRAMAALRRATAGGNLFLARL